MIVDDILNAKGSIVKTTLPGSSIQRAAEKMAAEKVGALVVSDHRGVLLGIITERDVALGLAAYGRGLHDLTVSSLMTHSVVTCMRTDSLAKISRIMTERRLRHLPVSEAGQLVGLVSIGDVLKSRLDEMQLETSVLRDIALAAR